MVFLRAESRDVSDYKRIGRDAEFLTFLLPGGWIELIASGINGIVE
jgi:hypothetical protein